ncbi:site-specific DNA-methyltransferase [Clostridium kluyveri]|uniref:DNA methylase N-4/N-6 domain-containing protein n=1 Tax=Clostridium kluyveri TaxID=1534 RepID=A0A1L5F317_CLOKL|nr:site-specific DNA-methyltransferase [Clostridium kluyveri]APM37394.1 hypothetical protein BS101_00750 [Clostridium kluyveri]
MDELKMRTKSKVNSNIEIIGELFPNTITEVIKGYDKNHNPIIEKAIDFEILKQELSKDIVEGREERYQMNWPGKKEAILKANTPINKTLRPCREESVDFDKTENLYIEGDNLEVLKLLQETYLNKVKMIYIDPPYNTGKDSFVYPDNFAMDDYEFSEASGQYDEDGNIIYDIRKNNENNGKFHTDWLNMMYPRLKLAKDLLSKDGIIFISIDEREFDNLKKICNEIFGEKNFVGIITWEKRTKAQNTETAREQFQSKTEYIFVYKKKIDKMTFNLEVTGEKLYNLRDDKGYYREKVVEEMSALGMRGRKTMIFPIMGVFPSDNKQWKVGVEQVKFYKERGDIFIRDNKVYFKVRPGDESNKKYAPFWSHFFKKDVYGTAETGKAELSEILKTKFHGFETVKPVALIKKLLFHVKKTNNVDLKKDDIVLDFFSGSGTTAQAVMEINKEHNNNIKFILVQLSEPIEEKQSKYKNICEIGKERIRRAGKKIKEENPNEANNLDIGFRVLKVDSSNMKDVFYNPAEYSQTLLDNVKENIKEDRSSEDLLFQVMLDLGELLSSHIEEIEIEGKKVFNVGQGNIISCFDDNITNEVVTEIAKMKPFYAIFRDSSLSNDSVATNFEQIFKTYSPNTIRKVL